MLSEETKPIVVGINNTNDNVKENKKVRSLFLNMKFG
jgi:hypothetical protein